MRKRFTVIVPWKHLFLPMMVCSTICVASAQFLSIDSTPGAVMKLVTELKSPKTTGSANASDLSIRVVADDSKKNQANEGTQYPFGNETAHKSRQQSVTSASSLSYAAAATAADLGRPILVISSTTKPFSKYSAEILLAEGLNQFMNADISEVSADLLGSYDVLIVGDIPLTDAQVAMLSNWTNAGGTLIALKPDVKLAPLLGLVTAGRSLENKYLLVHSAAGPGKGITSQTMQYQGTADLYNLNGASAVATLYSDAGTATTYPAVTTRSVGDLGGTAVAFTYDLASSIVYTRQGNPAWAGQKRDGQGGPIRSDDQFYPDWVNLNKVAVPQADEQQRLFANIITLNSRKPVPRLWYLPRKLKAAVVMTGDDHGNGGTKGRFNQYLSLSPDNSADAVADWRAIRGTSYIYPNTPLTDAEAKAFEQQGFEVALHLSTNCENFTPASLDQNFTEQLAAFKAKYTSIAAPKTNRTHCIAWSDWQSEPTVELAHGIRLDANYYYWPSAWINNRPGMFTGSSIPMRFVDLNGSLIDCYQLTTQMTDESDQTFPYNIDQLLDKALGLEGYYGVFCANMHTDAATSDGSDKIVASAMARGVPVISAKQLLTWLDGRNGSSFSATSWNGSELSFTANVAAGARNLMGMLPITQRTGQLVSLKKADGTTVAFTTESIKGVTYAFFPCENGDYLAIYDINAQPNQAPTVAITAPVNNAGFTAPASVTITADAADQDGSVVKVEFYQGATKLGEDVNGSNGWSFAWSSVPAGNYSLTAKATDNAGEATVSAATKIIVSAVCPCYVFQPSDGTASGVYRDITTGTQLGMKFRTAINGYVTGVRYYKPIESTGTHIGQLYSSSGNLLAQATFVNETASGWQEVAFASPVPVSAGTTYIISYHSSDGYYAATSSYFSQAKDANPLLGLANGEDGPNGLYSYSPTPVPPTNSFGATSYWVDVVFNNTTTPPSNQAPTVAITAPVNNAGFTAPASVTITADAADQDGSVVKVEFYQGATKLGEDVNGSNGWSFAWSSVPAGNYSLTAKATDNAGEATVSAAVAISVTSPANNPPVVSNPITDQTAVIGSAFNFAFADNTFSDPDNDMLSYSAGLTGGLALPSWLTFSSASRTFSGTPPSDSPSSLSIQVTANDGRGGTVSDDFLLSISQPVNQPPVLAAIGSKTVNELSTLTFTATATDDGLPSNKLAYSLAGAPAEAKVDATTGTFSWTPAEDQGPGQFKFKVIVTDGVLTDDEEILVQVNEVNQPPVLATVGDKAVGVGQTLRFTMLGSDRDYPVQTLTYSANKLPAGASLDALSGVFFWTPTAKQVGSYKLNLRVSDGITQTSENITITVSRTATQPTPAIAYFSPTSGSVGTAVVITGSNFTAGSMVAFGATQATAVTVNSESMITATVPVGAVTGKISVSVNNMVATSSTDFVVTTSSPGNTPPVVSISSPTNGATYSEPATITVSASATDDGSVSRVDFYSAGGLIGTDTDGSNGWSFTWSNVPAGTYSLTAKATDDMGAETISAAVSVTVSASTPAAPVVAGFSPATGAVGDRVTISGKNFLGASAVTFNGTRATSYAVTDATSIAATVPTGATTGKIGVTTAGGSGLSATDFTVVVVATTPVITSISPTTGAVGDQVLINGTGLANATKVTFGPSAAKVLQNEEGYILAEVPSVNGKLPSSVKVTVTTLTGSSTYGGKFTITAPALAATSTNQLQADELQEGLLSIYPNPFSSKATISFALKQAGSFSLSLFDSKGALVAVLEQGQSDAGKVYTAEVDAAKLAKGLYLVRLQTDKGLTTARVVLDR